MSTGENDSPFEIETDDERDRRIGRMIRENVGKRMSEDNINENGAVLSADMTRKGFHRFPQSDRIRISKTLYDQIARVPWLSGPLVVYVDANVPVTEVWYQDSTNNLLGRIVNLGAPIAPPVAHVTQNDALDFKDDEGNQPKVKKQKDRREKDALL